MVVQYLYWPNEEMKNATGNKKRKGTSYKLYFRKGDWKYVI